MTWLPGRWNQTRYIIFRGGSSICLRIVYVALLVLKEFITIGHICCFFFPRRLKQMEGFLWRGVCNQDLSLSGQGDEKAPMQPKRLRVLRFARRPFSPNWWFEHGAFPFNYPKHQEKAYILHVAVYTITNMPDMCVLV